MESRQPKIQFHGEENWSGWLALFREMGFAEGVAEDRGDVIAAPPGHGLKELNPNALVEAGVSILFLEPHLAPAASDLGGALMVTTTHGVCPPLAQQMVQLWEEQWAQACPEFLALYRELREHFLDGLPADYRMRLTQQLIESDVLDLLHRGHLEQARKLAFRVVGTTTRRLD